MQLQKVVKRGQRQNNISYCRRHRMAVWQTSPVRYRLFVFSKFDFSSGGCWITSIP